MAEAVVKILVARLASFLEEESETLLGVRQEADYMRAELERVTAFLRVVDAREDDDPQLKVWVRQVRDVAYDMDDVLDEFIIRLAHNRDGHGFYGRLRRICYFVKKLKTRRQIASKIRDLKSRVSDIAAGNRRYIFPPHQSSSSIITTRTSYDYRGVLIQKEAEIVGFEKPKQQLVTWLVDNGSSRSVQCISVIGMGGSGKTTLVKKVYDDPLVKKHFQSHLWLVISQSFNLRELLLDIVQQLFREIKQPAPQDVESMNENILKEIIDEFLQQRKYILVIDDVWSVPAWELMKDALPDNNCGSRMILTTRLADVASASRIQTRGNVYTLKALSQEESWTLFCRKTFPESYSCPPHLREISQSILSRCEGLPLAIVVVGGVLSTKDKSRIDEWEMFHCSLPVELEVNQRFERLKKIISLSYYDLPYYLRICFLYMSLFPEDKQIRNGSLIQLWVAQGFVQEREGMAIEDVAREYLYELINRSLVQVAGTYNDGRLKSCRIHDLLREISLLLSKEQKIVSMVNGSTGEMARHLAIHQSIENVQVSRNYFSRLRSFLIFDDSLSVKTLLPPILRSSIFLKVLDLKGAPLDVIPDEIFGLLHLSYLSLRGTKVRILPKLIVNLKKLETLDLKETYVTSVPNGIVKLVQLRYLIVGRNDNHYGDPYTPFHIKGFKIPSNTGALLSLQKLSKVEVDDQARGSNSISILSEIAKLAQLRSLCILKLRREDGMALWCSLLKLTNLRSLRLCSIGEEEVVDLEALSTTPPLLPFLKSFTCVGRLQKAPDWLSSLHSLVYIGLGWSNLEDGSGLLSSLQGLPNLVKLRLDYAYKGESLCFKAGEFQRLRELWLVGLQRLKWVRIDQGAMPFLDRLCIWRCKLLDGIPFGMEHLTNLRLLELVVLPKKITDPLHDKDGENGDYRKISHIREVWISNLKNGVWDGHFL